MADPELLVDFSPPLAKLTLNRPHRLNAVSRGMYGDLDGAFDRIAEDRGVRAVVLTGAGRAFCVGADLKSHGEGEMDDEQRRAYAALGQRVCQRIQECTRPVVAAVNGHAIGAGLEMALACDLLVIAEEAKLRFPEIGLGTFVGGGVTVTLVQRVGMTRAKELVLCGRFFRGAEAHAWGLCNEVTPAAEVLERAGSLAVELAHKAPVSMGLAKELLHGAWNADMATALAREADALVSCMRTKDWKEGIDAFEQKREPRFTGQ